MAQHKAMICEVKQLSDGAISFLARCCGDQATDSWHTIYPKVGETTDQTLDAACSSHCDRVSKQHEVTLFSAQYIKSKMR